MNSSKQPVLLFIINVDWFFLSHRLPVALAAQEQGYEVHIAAGFTDQYDQVKSYGFKVHHLRLQRGETNLMLSLRTLFDIWNICQSVNPTVIHFVTIQPIILGGIACHFLRSRPLVFSVSGLGYIFSSTGLKAKFRKALISLFYRLALAHRNIKVIFQNKYDLTVIRRATNLCTSQISVIPGSGVDLSKYVPHEVLSEPPIVLFASRLLSSKGIFDFLEASRMVSNARFVVAGKFDADNRESLAPEELEQWVQRGPVEYWGFSDNVPDLINQSSIVVLPSYYGEGLPKVLVEAAACGRPVVTTDHPGCRDAILPGVSGLLVPIRDPIALAVAIQELINDPSQRLLMGRAGRSLAERNFDINKVVSTHLDIYSQLIAKNL